MPIVYLTPEDLTLGQTNEVLNFLNSVQSAEEIARRIEIADELDVGVRVGQHILDHRAQLENGFVNLQQLMDVYHVGPERFTEIVSVVLGLSLPQFSPTTIDQLVQREVAAQLRGMPRQPVTAHTAVGGEAYRIAVQPPARQSWLGEEITLTLKVTHLHSGKPVANLPVSLESSDMWLSTQFGYDIREGRVVNTRTATDGSIRLRLRMVFQDRLTVDQLQALQQSLRQLDADAAAPRDIQDQFQTLAQSYEDVRNKQLRTAIDMVFRSTSAHLTASLSQQDYLYQWQYHSGLLRVYLDADMPPKGSPQPVADVTAAQVGIWHIPWKLWLLPWYQVYLQLLSGSELRDGFLQAKENSDNETGITSAILGQAYRFVAGRNGLVGEALGKQIVDREIHHFLAREITSFPADIQHQMMPSLLLAGQSINRADTGTLALVNQTRTDMEGIIDKRLGDSGINNDELLSSLSALNQRMDQVDQQISVQDGRYSQLQQQVGSLQNSYASIDSNILSLQSDISQLSTDVSRLDTDFSQINDQFQQLELDLNAMDTNVKELQLDVERINNDVVRVNTDVTRLDNQVNTLDTRVQTVTADVDQVSSSVQTLDNQIGQVETRYSTLNQEVSTLNKNAVLTSDITRDSQGRLLDIRDKPLRG